MLLNFKLIAKNFEQDFKQVNSQNHLKLIFYHLLLLFIQQLDANFTLPYRQM